MLKVQGVHSVSDKTKILHSFDPSQQTWIVSDLRNKLTLQKHFLDSQGFCEDSGVLRVSEFWHTCLRRTDPDVQVVGKDYVRAIVREYLQKTELVSRQKSEPTVTHFMDQFSSVVFNTTGPQMLREWFSENPNSLGRWGGWYTLAEDLLTEFLNKKQLSQSWLAGYLASQSGWQEQWDRGLVVDLGSQITRIEAELFVQLSKHVDVIVLQPMGRWNDSFSYLLRPYESFSQKDSAPVITEESALSRKTFRFSSQLAEVKHCTSQVRSWLEQGVSPNSIALIAPEVESYHTLLEPFFAEEGLALEKKSAVRMHSLPAIADWVAQLRIALGNFSYSDLEQSFYSHRNPISQAVKIRSEEFRAIFASILDASDLSRHTELLRRFETRALPSEALTGLQFLSWAASYWPAAANTDYFATAAKDVLATAAPGARLAVSSWFFLLEQALSKRELGLGSRREGGIELVNVLSGDSPAWTHRIFLGLSEEQFQRPSLSLLTVGEIEKLARDLGFYLDHPEQNAKSYELYWMSDRSGVVNHFCFPATQADGSIGAPHPLWVNLSGQHSESVDIPAMCRWDSLASNPKQDFFVSQRAWSDRHFAEVLQAIRQDSEGQVESWGNVAHELSLSPSSIEDFLRCPFVFAAKKVFRLVDPPLVDLDLDRRVEGSLVHNLFEVLTAEPCRFDYTDEELRDLLDSLKLELSTTLGEERLWAPLRERHVKMAKRFLQFESELRKQFPRLSVVAREKDFEIKLKNHILKGKIDRIDGDHQGHVVVVDYKGRDKSEYNFANWMKKRQIQLGLYAWVIDQGWVKDFEQQEVIAALYYTYKSLSRERGFRLADQAGILYADNGKKSNSREDKLQFYEELKIVLDEVETKIDAGEFAPRPADVHDCKQCEWQGLCRAPHLNN